MYRRLTAKVQQLEDQIQQLQALRDELLPLIDQCQKNLSQSAPAGECVVIKEIAHEAENSTMG